MARKQKSPRERAARALCSYFDIPENTMFRGRPQWEGYLEQADVALKAALSPEEWERMKAEGPDVG
ncbi:hypothetical protein [Aquamicrobium soli]|uniref:Transcriptional regulator n=1 Tax=Aquamicrobium soli TaxID=1811518 RepID=A0ABV7KD49_9HYPH